MDDNPYKAPLEQGRTEHRWRLDPGWFWKPFHPSTLSTLGVILAVFALIVLSIYRELSSR